MRPFPIVFTDLDGTLLDHENYSYEAARPALESLRRRAIPLVLSTSKTAAEILRLREDPDFADCAAIVENGAGILQSASRKPDPKPTHARLTALVDGLPPALRACFSGFSSWSLETLAERTGLDLESAQRAACRDYTEPGIWQGSEQARRLFDSELGKLGISAQQGGRFLTLGFAASKADRMRDLVAAFRAARMAPVVTVALGDAPNDIEMLERADIGIVVPNPAHAGIPKLTGAHGGRILRAGAAGPGGWNDALLELLADPEFPPRGH